jgi:hypothetical protein
VVGVDLLPVEPVPGAIMIQADFTHPGVDQQMMDLLGGAPDLVALDLRGNPGIGTAGCDALAAALISGTAGEVLKETQRALGRSSDVEPDIAKRMELLAACSVDPVCDLELAVKLAEFAPVQFYHLTNQILVLSGQGPVQAKKRRGSGGTPPSEPPSV